MRRRGSRTRRARSWRPRRRRWWRRCGGRRRAWRAWTPSAATCWPRCRPRPTCAPAQHRKYCVSPARAYPCASVMRQRPCSASAFSEGELFLISRHAMLHYSMREHFFVAWHGGKRQRKCQHGSPLCSGCAEPPFPVPSHPSILDPNTYTCPLRVAMRWARRQARTPMRTAWCATRSAAPTRPCRPRSRPCARRAARTITPRTSAATRCASALRKE